MSTPPTDGPGHEPWRPFGAAPGGSSASQQAGPEQAAPDAGPFGSYQGANPWAQQQYPAANPWAPQHQHPQHQYPQHQNPEPQQQAGPFGTAVGHPYGSPYGPPPARPRRRWGRIVGLLLLALVVIALIVVALLAFLVGPRFARVDVLDRAAVEQGVTQIVAQDWKRQITGVHCPEDRPARRGTTFSCGAVVDGRPQSVPVDVLDDQGTYQVGQPR